MSEKLPKATHAGELKIGEVVIPCAVLEDGRRVLTRSALLNTLEMSPGGTRSGEERIGDFVSSFSGSSALTVDVLERSKPIPFRMKHGGRPAHGYRAEILVDICRLVLGARSAGVLHVQRAPVAERCERLLLGMAGVGIVALVDEATGYQADRKREELQAILAAYLAPEMRPWVREFPDEYYEGIFRLLKWKWDPESSARPGFVGILTRQLVYERMPDGVWAALDERAPTIAPGRRKSKLHQHLSGDVGIGHLRTHLSVICAFLRAAPSWPLFVQSVQLAFPKPGDQLSMFSLEDWMRENPPGATK